MQALLNQLNSLPGVIGSMVCDADGKLLAQVFPPTFELSRLQNAAGLLAERTAALETALGSTGMIDLRYANARIVVRPMDGARLLFLCTPSVNLELLAITASGALRRMERVPAAVSGPRPPAAGAGQLYEAVQRINALIERGKGDAFKIRGQIALKAGFSLDLIDPGTPDDPAMLQKLKAAAGAILGQSI